MRMWKKHNVELREKAKELYKMGYSCKTVAAKLKIGKDAVYYWIKQDDLLRTMSEAGKLRPHPKLLPEKRLTKDQLKLWKKANCLWCEKEFYGRKRYKKGTKGKWQECCSITCANKYRNKGYITDGGYHIIPAINGGKTQVRRCRYVMEQKLGRKLQCNEIVHHIDFDKSNDLVDNLYLCNTKLHKKAEVSLYNLVKALLKQKMIKFEKGRYLLV